MDINSCALKVQHTEQIRLPEQTFGIKRATEGMSEYPISPGELK